MAVSSLARPIPRSLPRLAAGAVLLLLVAAVYYLGVRTYPGQFLDNDVMRAVSGWFGIDVPNRGLLGQIQLPAFGAALAVLTAVLLIRPSPRHIGHAAVVVIGTVAVASLLKNSLERPSWGIGAGINSFPSNTVAAFVAVECAIVAAVSSAVRRWVGAAATIVAGALCVAVIALQWHRPADVVGALLLPSAISLISSALFLDDE
ncbi:hypothetical protein [Nocardia terpenica]|uniref:Phosphatidic acid phosphatase type 2/haloperoxidase domain-containing protein n=1 Tax=Nocardia terpenica TaxID=455432 RepID=A0A291RIZ0_9NOCA|nr:hypothetical protein [Nocardia terpenica]ATL67260.1 hypothetical protein CRH09_14705 [Nocardia terpenica]